MTILLREHHRWPWCRKDLPSTVMRFSWSILVMGWLDRRSDIMAEASLGQMIGPAVALMSAAVIAVPLFRRLRLGSVLSYFAAGMLIGPSMLGLFIDAQSILHFSELGVVIFPFVTGLELRPYKLWGGALGPGPTLRPSGSSANARGTNGRSAAQRRRI
jgi:hypothetical protein